MQSITAMLCFIIHRLLPNVRAMSDSVLLRWFYPSLRQMVIRGGLDLRGLWFWVCIILCTSLSVLSLPHFKPQFSACFPVQLRFEALPGGKNPSSTLFSVKLLCTFLHLISTYRPLRHPVSRYRINLKTTLHHSDCLMTLFVSLFDFTFQACLSPYNCGSALDWPLCPDVGKKSAVVSRMASFPNHRCQRQSYSLEFNQLYQWVYSAESGERARPECW
jgi:hypothetical protein